MSDFIVSPELKKLQNAQLFIANEIQRICIKNNIPCFLTAGTLLGAVRHSGFIPWDDDFDIGMMREDYEVFLKVFPTECDNKKFFLQTWDTDKGYGLALAKVKLNDTFFSEPVTRHTNIHKGIFVDIFPFDMAANTLLGAKIHAGVFNMFSKLFLYKQKYVPRGNSNRKFLLSQLVRCFAFFTPNSLLKKSIIKTATFFNKRNDRRVVCLYGDYRYKESVDREDFVYLIDMEFEKCFFKVPSNYKEYLTNVYGNYMQLPPIEQRGNRHGDVSDGKLDFGKYDF
jgi:lipopolysaccharide cholinephosphotransferase